MTAAAKDRNFKNHTQSKEDEDEYDYVKFRDGIHPVGTFGSVAHLVKGALGSGILSGHVAYSKGGLLVALPCNILIGAYMGFSLYLLVHAVQMLLRRTRKPFLSYADAGEAAMMLFPKKGLNKYAKYFRYSIDTIISMDLFGSCCTYQIIIAKSMKQLIENTHKTSLHGPPGYPGLRGYLAMMIPLYVLLSTIRHLKFLAPFSVAANVVIAFSVMMAIYYCSVNNPTLSGLRLTTSFRGVLQYVGMQVFSMSCSGLVIPVESNMKNPKRFPVALTVGMGIIIMSTLLTALFGYGAYKDESTAPITVNFPMTWVAKIFKFAICFMIFITHAVNFWVPFNLVWYYLKQRHTTRLALWERLYRALLTTIIGLVAVTFPAINALMGFIGSFCITHMSLIWPNVIYILTVYERPGYGPLNWRLWRSVIFLLISLFILFCGSLVNAHELIKVFQGKFEV